MVIFVVNFPRFPHSWSVSMINVSWVGIMAGSMSYAQESKSPLADFSVEFLRVEVEAKERAFHQPVVQLGELYAEQLRKLEAQMGQAGKLEEVLQVRKEAEGFLEGGTPEVEDFPQLRVLQRRYRGELAAREALETRNLTDLYKAYLRRLAGLQKELTQASRIDKAVLAQKEHERVTGLLQAMESGARLSQSGATVASSSAPDQDGSPGQLRAWGNVSDQEQKAKRRMTEIEEGRVRRVNDFVSLFVNGDATWYGIRSDGSVLGFEEAELGERKKRVVKVAPHQSYGPLVLYDDGTVSLEHFLMETPDSIRKELVGIVDIAVQGTAALALRKEGRVIGWGPCYGDGGVGILPPEVQSGIVQVEMNHHVRSFALREDGKVIRWMNGPDSTDPDTLILDLEDIVKISAGGLYVLALDRQGTVHVAGSTSSPGARAPRAFAKCTDIFADRSVSMVKEENGKWFAWGRNDGGLVDFLNTLEAPKSIAIDGALQVAFWIE